MFETPPHGRFQNTQGIAPRMVVYDFDRTLSTTHVFYELEDMREKLQQPTQLQVLEQMAPDQLQTNVMSWFQGNDRIQRLRAHLQTVRANGAEPIIISNGYSDVIRLCLQVTGLMEYFNPAHVHGWDHSARNGSQKAELIRTLMIQREFRYAEVLFLDDDCSNISEAEHVCMVRLVRQTEGIAVDDMEWVEGRFSPR